jgi:hypothetical protein
LCCYAQRLCTFRQGGPFPLPPSPLCPTNKEHTVVQRRALSDSDKHLCWTLLYTHTVTFARTQGDGSGLKAAGGKLPQAASGRPKAHRHPMQIRTPVDYFGKPRYSPSALCLMHLVLLSSLRSQRCSPLMMRFLEQATESTNAPKARARGPWVAVRASGRRTRGKGHVSAPLHESRMCVPLGPFRGPPLRQH